MDHEPTYHYLSVEADAVVARSKPLGAPPLAWQSELRVASVNELDNLRRVVGPHDIVMCASSLDFPEEYTSNRDVLAVCEHIRGVASTPLTPATSEQVAAAEIISALERVVDADDDVVALVRVSLDDWHPSAREALVRALERIVVGEET
jgi:hypothetical protein